MRGARERWRMCGVVRPRRRLPLRPFPCPRPVDRFATGQRCPERVACEMRRTESVALDAAGVISGRTSASGRLYVSPSRRLIRSPGRLRAEGCGWDGRGVVSTVRGSARHGGGQGAAARRHSEQQQLSTWCTGRGGEAAGDERAAGWRRRTLALATQVQGPPVCMHCAQAARVQEAMGSACAECEMRRRRAAGRRRRTSARDPSRRAALHAVRGGELCELGATRGKRTLVVLDRDREASAERVLEAERERGFWSRWPPR